MDYFTRTVLDACMCASQLLVAVFVDAVRLQGGLSMYTDLQRSWLMYKDKIMSLKMTVKKLIQNIKKQN